MCIVLLSTDINDCIPDPCQNGATCVDLVGSYRCDCVAGYTGSNCETSKHLGKKYRVFSHDITAAILVSQNNETAAMLVSQINPLGVELFSYANAFFCSNKSA